MQSRNVDTRQYGQSRNFAQLGRSQMDAFVGKNNESSWRGKDPQKPEKRFGPIDLEVQNKSSLDAARLFFIASKEFDDACKAATPHQIESAVNLAQQIYEKEGNPDGEAKPDDPDTVVNLAQSMLDDETIPSGDGKKSGDEKTPDQAPHMRSEHSSIIMRLTLLLLLLMIFAAACAPMPINANDTPSPVATRYEPHPTDTAIATSTPIITGVFTVSPKAPTIGTATAETNPTPIVLVYPESDMDWVDAGNSNDNKELIEAQAPGAPAIMEKILKDRVAEMNKQGKANIRIVQFHYGLAKHGWSIVFSDQNGQIWYAVGAGTDIPYIQLAPFNINSDEWELTTKALSDPGNTQELMKSKDGKFFTVFERDSKGRPVSWLNLKNGQVVKIMDIRLSLDKAKQASSETISIKGDYGYNEKGGVVSMFDDETGDWIPLPFGEEDLKKLASMQWVKWPFYLYGEDMIVIKVHEYGEPNLANPNEGAKPILDASGKIVAYVALSVDAINSNGQIAEIPVVLYSADRKKIVIFYSVIEVRSGSWIEKSGLESIVTLLLPQAIYNTLSTEEKALYDDPAQWGMNRTDKKPRLGMGDRIGVDYSKKGYTSLAPEIAIRMEALGITLSDLNDLEGFAKYLETGDITFLNDDDLILIMLLPDAVRIIKDAAN